MSPGQINEWLAYQKVRGPLGVERMDAYVAMLIQVIAATAGAKVEGKDALPNWRPTKQLDPAELWALYEAGQLGEAP